MKLLVCDRIPEIIFNCESKQFNNLSDQFVCLFVCFFVCHKLEVLLLKGSNQQIRVQFETY